jgi:hypothetical protein
MSTPLKDAGKHVVRECTRTNPSARSPKAEEDKLVMPSGVTLKKADTLSDAAHEALLDKMLNGVKKLAENRAKRDSRALARAAAKDNQSTMDYYLKDVHTLLVAS